MEKGEELRTVTDVYRGFVGAGEKPSSSSYLEEKRKCFKEVALSKVDKGKESLIFKHKWQNSQRKSEKISSVR